MTTSYKYGVVGTGPLAASAIQFLCKNGEIPLVIDLGETIKKHTTSKKSIDYGLLKSFQGNYFPYWIENKFFNFTSEVNMLFPSKAFGGFSKVWGATLNVPPLGNSLLRDFYAESNVLRGLDIDAPRKGNLQPQFLAVSRRKCTGCGECLVGCRFGAIWDSSIYIENLLQHRNIAYIQDEVTLIEESDMHFVICGKNAQYKVEKLVLCAGTLGNLQILAQSGLIEGSIQLSETRMFFGLMFDLKLRLPKRRFSLSTSQLNLEFEKSAIHLQLYEDMRGLSYRYLKRRQADRPLTRLLFSIAARLFSPFIGYLPTDSSPQVRIELDAKGGTVSTLGYLNFSRRFKVWLQLFFKLLKTKRVLIGIRFTSAGAGYHLGNLHGGAVADSIRETSKLPSLGNLLILDSGMLRRIAAGAITLPTMEEAVLRIEAFYQKEKRF